MVFEVLNHSQSVRSRILSGHIDQASQAHIPLVSHMFRTRLESDVGWKMWWCGRHTCLRLNPPVTVLMRQRSVGIESILDFCGKFVDLLRIGSKVWKPGWLKHHRTSWSRFSLIWAVRLPYLTAWANTPQQETESHKFTPRPRQTWAPGCNRGVMDKRLKQRRKAARMEHWTHWTAEKWWNNVVQPCPTPLRFDFGDSPVQVHHAYPMKLFKIWPQGSIKYVCQIWKPNSILPCNIPCYISISIYIYMPM